MVCDGSKRFKIAAKCLISSHRVAGPYTGHAAAILEETNGVGCDGLRCF